MVFIMWFLTGLVQWTTDLSNIFPLTPIYPPTLGRRIGCKTLGTSVICGPMLPPFDLCIWQTLFFFSKNGGRLFLKYSGIVVRMRLKMAAATAL